MNLSKSILRAFAACTLATGAILGAVAPAYAQPTDTHIDVSWYMPPTVNFVGQNDFCTATIDFRVEKDPTVERGITLIVTGRGANSPLPSWTADSTCRVELEVGIMTDPQNVRSVTLDIPSHPAEVFRETYVSRGGPETAYFSLDFFNTQQLRIVPQASYPGGAMALFNVP